MKTNMPLPQQLLVGEYADGRGGYDAIGWMLRHLLGLESRYINKSRMHVRQFEHQLATGLGINRDELMELTARLDNAHPKIRVRLFMRWAEEHGLTFDV